VKKSEPKWGDYSRLRRELYCEHGVGHGYHVHGCDGCCSHKSFEGAYEKAVADLGADSVKTESCRCNLFGMKHKRTSACDVFEQITMPELSQKDSEICDKITLPALRKRDKEGIKSQKHIFKEWSEISGVPNKGTSVPKLKRRKK
jgi:hypothetical protein